MKGFWTLGLILILISGCAPRALVRVATAYADKPGQPKRERTGIDHSTVRIAEELKRNGIKFGMVGSLAASFSVEKKDEGRARKVISELIQAEDLNASLEPQVAR